MKTSDSIVKIAPAFLAAQKSIGAAPKSAKNPFYKSNYADLGTVMEACKDALNDNGIAVLQPVGTGPDGSTYVETILLHESGEYISDRMPVTIVPATIKDGDNKISIPTPQAQGSAITYARRYSLQSMLFIPAEDDDANKATGTGSKSNQNAQGAAANNAAHGRTQETRAAANTPAPQKSAPQTPTNEIPTEGELKALVKKHTILKSDKSRASWRDIIATSLGIKNPSALDAIMARELTPQECKKIDATIRPLINQKVHHKEAS